MTSNWTLLASHGTVLFYIAAHHDATIREVATATELTERRVSQIIKDLSNSDILSVERRGRRNAYYVNPEAPFPNPLQDVRMDAILRLIRDVEMEKVSA